MAIDEYSVPTFRGGVLLTEMSEPSTPDTGTLALFTGTDGYVYAKNDAGQVWGIRPPPSYDSYTTANTSLSTSYANYTGQPTITVRVPNSGRLRVTAGLKGSHTTAGSSVRVAVVFSGTNSLAADDTGGVVMLGGGSSSKHQLAQRTTLYTGLNPGLTTVKLQARTSNSSGEALEESWLVVQPIP